MTTTDREIANPDPNPETQVFWDAAGQGKLMIKICKSCNEAHYYPRALCPHCLSDQTEWVEAKGTGEVYTFSVMKRAKVSFTIAYVTLDEGVKMLTNIVDTDFDKVTIGQKVKVVFKPSENGQAVPMFTPA